MSANLYWEPTGRTKHDLDTSTPSGTIKILMEIKGGSDPPFYFDEAHLPILVGVSAACKDRGEIFNEMIKAIETHGEITVSVQY